jgi:VIT1/CCC1 family predicted Fe2+/Mn2+ transporter
VDTPSDRTEDEQEQLNRQLNELLQELRVAMPGVQILFGFLLAVPFNQRFASVSDFQRDVYLVTLLAAAAAGACFIAPSAYHRIMFRQGDKRHMIRLGSRMAVAGLACLAIAMTSAVLLVTDFLFSKGTTAVVTVVVFALFAWLWFGLGLTRRLQGARSH